VPEVKCNGCLGCWMTDRTNLLGLTAVAAERLHQARDTRLVLHAQRSHHLVEVRPMIAAVAARAVKDMCVGSRVAVVAAITRDTRAIEVGKGRGQPSTLGCSRGHETVECSDPIRLARRHRSASGSSMERLGRNPRG
jgi:hypothetical protein